MTEAPQDPPKDSRLIKWAITALWAAIATASGPWGDLVPTPLGALVVAFCLAAIAYVQLVRPHRRKLFEGDRAFAMLGLVCVGALLAGGTGAFVWLQFPREITDLEQLEPRYIRCRALVRREVKSGEELEIYTRDAGEWLSATREWIRLNLEPIALERFVDTSGILPITMDGEFSREHRDRRNTITRYCDNLAVVMDEYADR